MTMHVHSSPMFSMTYGAVGIPSLRNLIRIIVLQLPEWGALDTRENPCPTLYKEITPR